MVRFNVEVHTVKGRSLCSAASVVVPASAWHAPRWLGWQGPGGGVSSRGLAHAIRGGGTHANRLKDQLGKLARILFTTVGEQRISANAAFEI